jgi:hypothetical protein
MDLFDWGLKTPGGLSSGVPPAREVRVRLIALLLSNMGVSFYGCVIGKDGRMCIVYCVSLFRG